MLNDSRRTSERPLLTKKYVTGQPQNMAYGTGPQVPASGVEKGNYRRFLMVSAGIVGTVLLLQVAFQVFDGQPIESAKVKLIWSALRIRTIINADYFLISSYFWNKQIENGPVHFVPRRGSPSGSRFVFIQRLASLPA